MRLLMSARLSKEMGWIVIVVASGDCGLFMEGWGLGIRRGECS